MTSVGGVPVTTSSSPSSPPLPPPSHAARASNESLAQISGNPQRKGVVGPRASNSSVSTLASVTAGMLTPFRPAMLFPRAFSMNFLLTFFFFPSLPFFRPFFASPYSC